MPLIANDDKGSTYAGQPVPLDVLANDTLDGSPVTLGDLAAAPQVVAPPQHGTTSSDRVSGLVTYTPSPGAVGKDSFQYEISEAGEDGPIILELLGTGTFTSTGIPGSKLVFSDGSYVILNDTDPVPTVAGQAEFFLPETTTGAGWASLTLGGTALEKVISWGALPTSITHFRFQGAVNLIEVPTTLPAHLTDLRRMFYGAEKFNFDINGWDVGSVERMDEMFALANSFNQPLGLWNVGNVLNMEGMFLAAVAFNQPIGAWNVSSVQNMSRMFNQAISFDQPIGGWIVSNVEEMRTMFANAHAFDQDLGTWDVSYVVQMDGMFFNALSFNQDLSGWCVPHLAPPHNPLPFQFDAGAVAWTLPYSRPVWGTCP